MDMPTAAKAASLFRDFEAACKAIATLEVERPLYFFTTGENQGIAMPDNIRSDLVRHYRKVKETCQADIEAL